MPRQAVVGLPAAAKALFWGENSTGVVFGASSAKLASIFRIGYPYEEVYLALQGRSAFATESGHASADKGEKT